MMENKPLPREIVTTTDGSHTLYIPQLGEHYHSIHGAIQESEHVFIQNGLSMLREKPRLRILEIGFGTGLNAILTLKYATENNLQVDYTTIEKYPLQPDEYQLLNHGKVLGDNWVVLFTTLHQIPWESKITVNNNLTLTKKNVDLVAIDYENTFDLVYFDAFAPTVQPHLWTECVFKLMYRTLLTGGILVTYSAKGQVRRNMQAAGFKVERLPGPPGKREMLRATKNP